MKSIFNAKRLSDRSRQPGRQLRLTGTNHLFTTSSEIKLADSLEIAEEHRLSGAWFEAEQAYEAAEQLGAAAGISPSAQAVMWIMNGEFQEQLNHRRTAVECYQRAAAATDASAGHAEDQVLRYLTHNNLAWLLKAEDRYADSEAHYVKAANLATEAGEAGQADSITIHNNLGALYHAAGYFDAAGQMHRTALEMLDKAPLVPPAERVRSLRLLALAALFQNDLNGALATLEHLRTLGWEHSGVQEERIIELLVTESSIRLTQQNLKEAEVFALRAIEFCLDAQRRVAPLLPLLYTNLAGIYTHADHMEDATDILQDAHLMRLSNLHCTDEEMAISYHNMIILAARQGDTESLERHHQRMLKLGAQPPTNLGVISDLSPQELAARLTTYTPAPMAPLVENSLGPAPSGLTNLQSWLGKLGKTMRIPRKD